MRVASRPRTSFYIRGPKMGLVHTVFHLGSIGTGSRRTPSGPRFHARALTTGRPAGWYTGKDVVTRGQDEAAQRSRLAERAEPSKDFIVTVTNGSGRKEMEIRASGQSVAFNYAARVCEHEGAGFYPAEVRPKDGTS